MMAFEQPWKWEWLVTLVLVVGLSVLLIWGLAAIGDANVAAARARQENVQRVNLVETCFPNGVCCYTVGATGQTYCLYVPGK